MSVRPGEDMPLAMRLVCADSQPEIERLARAVQSVRDIDHRAVLQPLQMVRSSTKLGVITRDVEGLTLAQLLATGNGEGVAVPPPVTLRIIVDVIEGLDALRAHATATRRQDWLFAGLTPDNVLVGTDGQSRLIDASLAGAAARLPAFAHEPAALAYTAPELTGPDAHYAAVNDVFSLGVMLWELLTGQPLFAAATAAQTLENLHRAPIERVQRQQFVRGEPIPFALAQTVARALHRDPARRLADYDALMSALMQAGPVGRPETVAELVQHSTCKEASESLKARLERTRQLATQTAPVTSPKITLPLSMKTQPGLAPPSFGPPIVFGPSGEPNETPTTPPQAASLSQPAAPSEPTHVQPADVATTSPLPIVSRRPEAPFAVTSQQAMPHRYSSSPPTARMRKPPVSTTRPTQPIRPVPRSLPPPRLHAELIDQVSAFPIGDLRRPPPRRSSLIPAALAAMVLLGIGAWSLRWLDREGDDPTPASPSAASGRAPEVQPAAGPAAPPGSAAGAASQPGLAGPQNATNAADHERRRSAAPTKAAPPKEAGPTRHLAPPIGSLAKPDHQSSSNSASRTGPRSDLKAPSAREGAKPPAAKQAAVAKPTVSRPPAKRPDATESAQKPNFADLPPPEPESVPHTSVLKITPAPENPDKPPEIPEDI